MSRDPAPGPKKPRAGNRYFTNTPGVLYNTPGKKYTFTDKQVAELVGQLLPQFKNVWLRWASGGIGRRARLKIL